MNEYNYVQTAPQQAPQQTPQPDKKRSGSSSVWIILLILGALLFFTGLILYKTVGSGEKYNVINYNNSFDADDINKLDLDIAWSDFTINISNDDKIYVDAKNVPSNFKAEVRNNVFMINYKKKGGFISNIHIPFLLDDSYKDSTVEISLPEKVYDSFLLNMGAGKTYISGLSCDQFKMECGAGEVNINKLKCSGADIDCGAGELTLSNIDCEHKLIIDGGAGEINISGFLGGIDLDQGVGEFTFTGAINGNIDADGGIGSMEFNLTNPSSDFGSNGKYSIDIDTGVGSSSVNYDQ
ncbi:MAG: DUF4097 domain-containing protein [Ruminococcus sp.]|uniref:DUF4097 family beta strand repeat-containing protein n=1 Tax=Ruminococcus sp. TaxID=41978 RepID=UPI0025F699CD|nr:DUF4097 family beta strand repeat-containing protein [Ruminococcus sp.]MCR5600856.1 DUF4097 domain-containing protein [Ruminococcus sp.]